MFKVGAIGALLIAAVAYVVYRFRASEHLEEEKDFLSLALDEGYETSDDRDA